MMKELTSSFRADQAVTAAIRLPIDLSACFYNVVVVVAGGADSISSARRQASIALLSRNNGRECRY
jgi:hypothetical protein